MSLAKLNSSTLSEALTTNTSTFAVASTTNIAVGNLLAISGTAGLEMVKVRDIPVSGQVTVTRGVAGTRAVQAASGTRFYIGAPDAFKRIVDTMDQSYLRLVGTNGNYPDYALPGTRARDGAGNEYVMVEITTQCYSGTTVVISNDGQFTAVPAVGGTQGSIGLLVEEASSSYWTWAQIYGYNSFAQDSTVTSAADSTYTPLAATSVSTPNVGLTVLAAPTTVAQYLIHSMFIVGAATSTVTSASSATGTAVPVFLNYPFTLNRRETIDSSNS